MSRRGLLRAGAITGGGLVAAAVAACTPAGGPLWTYGPAAPTGGAAGTSPTPAPSTDHGSTSPSGTPPMDHDANALAVVERFLGGEATQVEGLGNQPLEPTRVEAGVKVWDMTIDKISHRIDAVKEPVDALGFNGMWPGPRIEVIEGDRVRFNFRNNLDETTGIHFHGQRVPNNMDGVPHVTQDPIQPGQVVHLRVHRPDPRLAHVPLAPQRHRPGRSRVAGRVHRPAARCGAPV